MMKICPSCRKTYTDASLNFCLDDGSMLTVAGAELAETMVMSPPRFTDPNAPMTGGPAATQKSWSNQPQAIQPRKSSKSWIWVLGIFGALILLCGGGFAAFIVYVASLKEDAAKSEANATKTIASPAPFERSGVQTVDLSGWVSESADYGSTEFAGGELRMSSKQKGYYYVLAAPDEYKTEAAATRVTVRNIDDQVSSLGYGLIFHSDSTPLVKDYAFLIDSKRKQYRVARHEPEKEISVVSWTSSTAINDGTEENTLEARDKTDNIELYINGRMVTSIKNTHGFKGGVAGLYSGDAVKVGFKKLEIVK